MLSLDPRPLVASLLQRLYGGARSLRERSAGETVLFYPPFADRKELLHHYYAARYFLPSRPGRRVILLVEEGALPGVEGDLPDAPPPAYLGACARGDGAEVSLVRVAGGISLPGMLLRYLPRHLFLCSSLPGSLVGRVAAAIGLSVNVDRHSAWGCYNYPDYRYLLQEEGGLKAQRAEAQRRFRERVAQLPRFRKAYVFGTGPSVTDAYRYDFSDGYRIVCNTMIKNRELMAHLKPHFLVAGDAIYHFGISRYACRFREDLELFLREHDCLFLIPERYYPNFAAHHESLVPYTVPVPYTATSFNLEMQERFETKAVHNILNQLLLPLASSLAEEASLLGFDGRSSSDTQFWASLQSVNYEDLKGDHQEAHPGFFRSMDYQQYAEIQAELAEEIMRLGEGMGKRYRCLNESGNAALHRRYAGSADPVAPVDASFSSLSKGKR